MLVDRRQRVDAQSSRDLLIRRRIAVLLRESGKKVHYLFLPSRDRHTAIVANKRRNGNESANYISFALRRLSRLAPSIPHIALVCSPKCRSNRGIASP